jgi:hypothetical protein
MGRYIDLRSDAGGQYADNVGHYRPGASFSVEVVLVARKAKEFCAPGSLLTVHATFVKEVTLGSLDDGLGPKKWGSYRTNTAIDLLRQANGGSETAFRPGMNSLAYSEAWL